MLKNPDNYIDREISWLDFNERVLQEATDTSTPLLERARFLGIYSNNRDEFFRVRVATLRRLLKYETDHQIQGKTTGIILDQIIKNVNDQEKRFTAAYQKVVHDLAKKNIHLLNELELNEEQGNYLRQYFREHVRPFLFPLMMKNVKTLSGLKDDSFYLGVYLHNKESGGEYALVQVPIGKVPRFIELPGDQRKYFFIMLDDVIRYCLNEVFSVFGYEKFEAFTIKFTRDAEIEMDDDVSKSFMEIMSESVKRRLKGEPVRFVYDKKMPEELLKILIKKFNITKRDNIRAGGRYHNMKDFMEFPRVGPENLRYPEMPPIPHPGLPSNVSMFESIQKRDIMLHFPYHSFQYILELLREASIDPKVRSIKMTFYRAASDSKVMNALINAARNGKYVTVFMEIQARFDEEANIYWTNKLQDEGVKVIKTIPGFKVHAKLIMIRRSENNVNRYYANISTGNYNESTAKVYSDDSLLTANQDIAAEVNDVFHLFESKFIVPEFKTLIVAPFRIRKFFIEMLENEMENARAGKEAWIVLRINSLVDKKAIRKLYAASTAGVKIILIVRGICMLKAGVEGLSENITAFSIVDRYLEHSRNYIFCNGGKPAYYMGSADWMQRNFDHRVEVISPVFDKHIQHEMWDIIQIQIRDNVKARWLDPEKLNSYRRNEDDKQHRSQFEIYEYLKEKSENADKHTDN